MKLSGRGGVPVDGDAFRRERLAAGLTLAQVGGAEMSRQAVHQIERGTSRPTVRSLRAMADRLGVSASALLAPGTDETVLESSGGTSWTADEDRLARGAIPGGVGAVAESLGRSRTAVRVRRARLRQAGEAT